MTKEDKIICHLQQACGACAAFNNAWARHQTNCEYKDKHKCDHKDGETYCCASTCPTFDRYKILENGNGKDEKK